MINDYGYKPFRSVFLRLALSDATAFTLSLAYAVLFQDQAIHGQSEEADFTDIPESIKYYSRSVRDLTARLNDPIDRLSEGVIGTITGFVCHDV